MKIPLLLFVFLVMACTSRGQDLSIVNVGDSMRTLTINQVEVLSKKFSSKEERIAFERLKYNTIKAYPYAQMAVEIFDEMKEDVAATNKRRERKKYVNEKEKDLRARFEKEIRDMTRSQGEILIKLINRDTGNSCYEIVKDLKGGFTAFFWNIGGRLYDLNLKEDYNIEENQDIELILKMIDNGQLQVKAIQ